MLGEIDRNEMLNDHDAPLAEVVATLHRRALLRSLVGVGLLTSPLLTKAACSIIPSETAGPFPGDGTNGPNILTQSGVVRSDIRSSVGLSGTATGTLMTVRLQVVNTRYSCGPLANHAVYLWHCDALGAYSMYSGTASGQNYLRGVQLTDANGYVSFTTIFPGCYSGRWPHMHFEVYESVDAANSGRNAIATSQLAIPKTACDEVYANANLYPQSAANLSRITLASDTVFSDDKAGVQLATTSGSTSAGYTATLQIGVTTATVPTVPAAQKKTTVEFYNTTLNQYVMLTDAAEIAFVEAGGAGAGWTRTGATFDWEPSPGANSGVVHRFYGSQSPGPNSHFYTISAGERDYLIALAAQTPATQKRWNYEAAGGFWAGTASNNSSCDANSKVAYIVPIYRLYNDAFAKGKDSNHRYTASLAVITQMQAQGWKLEGVAFCAVSATNPT